MPFLKKTGEVLAAADNDGSLALSDIRQEQATVLLAGHKPKTHVAKELNMTTAKLYEWLRDPNFVARLDYWRAVNYKAAIEAGAGSAKGRLINAVDQYERILQGVIDRSNDPFWDGYPGDDTCQMCRTVNGVRLLRGSWPECPECGYRPPIPEGKSGFRYYRHTPVPGGKSPFLTVFQIFTDNDTSKELRQLNQFIAQHMGEWNTQSVQHDVVIRQIVGINSDDL